MSVYEEEDDEVADSCFVQCFVGASSSPPRSDTALLIAATI